MGAAPAVAASGASRLGLILGIAAGLVFFVGLGVVGGLLAFRLTDGPSTDATASEASSEPSRALASLPVQVGQVWTGTTTCTPGSVFARAEIRHIQGSRVSVQVRLAYTGDREPIARTVGATWEPRGRTLGLDGPDLRGGPIEDGRWHLRVPDAGCHGLVLTPSG